MKNNIIIATKAFMLAHLLRDNLTGVDSREVVIINNEDDLLKQLNFSSPQLVLLEHCFDSHTIDEFIAWITKKYRRLRIAVWTAAEVHPAVAARYILAGAESFISLRHEDKEIREGLKKVLSGRPYSPADVELMVESCDEAPDFGLKPTTRQREIIRLASEGKSNREMADILGMSLSTLKWHKSNLYKRCTGKTHIHLVQDGLNRGIILAECFTEGKGGMRDDCAE
jgi:DNA-binding NarL/FixJ family response regulator